MSKKTQMELYCQITGKRPIFGKSCQTSYSNGYEICHRGCGLLSDPIDTDVKKRLDVAIKLHEGISAFIEECPEVLDKEREFAEEELDHYESRLSDLLGHTAFVFLDLFEKRKWQKLFAEENDLYDVGTNPFI